MIRQFGAAAVSRTAALLALGAVIVACSSSGDTPTGSANSTAPAASRLADLSSQFSPLSMNRTCTTEVASPECGTATATKIDLNKQVQPQLKAQPDTGLVGDALKVSDQIVGTGEAWSLAGCQTKPGEPACAGPAMTIESDFSALSAYLLQITGG